MVGAFLTLWPTICKSLAHASQFLILTLDRVELFFDNVQSWLPIIHRPMFYNKYVRINGERRQIAPSQSLEPDDALMITGMFALAARFSTSETFSKVSPLTRGKLFADRAAVLYDSIMRAVQEPSTSLVKGIVFHAFYYLTGGHAIQGAVLTGICVRLAFDLGLDEVDTDLLNEDGNLDKKDCGNVDEWIQREDLRRLWWIIYDLDTFVATISCRPYGIARQRMKVLLPVSDQHWFNGVPTISVTLLSSPGSTWKSLAGSPNQSARAWYILSNHLMSSLADVARRPSQVPMDTRAELESEVSCLKLALPDEFQLRLLHIDEDNFTEGHWIISTHLMILA